MRNTRRLVRAPRRRASLIEQLRAHSVGQQAAASASTSERRQGATRKDSLRAFAKLTRRGRRRAADRRRPAADRRRSRTCLARDRSATSSRMRRAALIRTYRRTLPRDRRHLLEQLSLRRTSARKVVGVGSVGTRAWIVLLLGRDDERPAVPAGQGGAAVGARAVPRQERRTRKHGQRVVEGQRLMQAASDILLGWLRTSTGSTASERDFYVRQLWDGKGSARGRDDGPRTALSALRAALRLDARPRARALRRPRSRSPPTSAGATRSTARSATSPRPTPTRTSATTRRSPPPSIRDA